MNVRIAAIVGISLLSVLAVIWFTRYDVGYEAANSDRNAENAALQKKVNKLQARVQKLLNEKGQQAQSLTQLNQERNNAIDTAGKRDRELSRMEDMWRSAMDEREEAIADNVGLVDMSHIGGVYRQAINECHGLPDSKHIYLVSREFQQSTSQSVAEGVKRLIGEYCKVAVNYNSIYKSYESSLEAKVSTD